MKKLVAIMLLLMLSVALFAGCNKQNGGNTSSSTAKTELKVYLITMDKTDQHWLYVDRGATQMADALGIVYKWDAPDIKDSEKQIEIIEKAVKDGANLILLAAVDPAEVAPIVENAKSKGVKFIFVDSPADAKANTTLSSDNYKAGQLAGQTMLDELKTLGKTSGKIAIISASKSTDSTVDRENGFKSILEKEGKFTLLPTEYKNGGKVASLESVTDLIKKNNDLVGVFGTDENSSIGAGTAIRISGKSIIGIGFDKSDPIEDLLNDGSLKATIAQNPYTMGYLGMAQAYAVLNGYQTGPDEINTGVTVLKKAPESSSPESSSPESSSSESSSSESSSSESSSSESSSSESSSSKSSSSKSSSSKSSSSESASPGSSEKMGV